MKQTKAKKQPMKLMQDDATKLDKEAWERLQAIIKSPPMPTPALKEMMRL